MVADDHQLRQFEARRPGDLVRRETLYWGCWPSAKLNDLDDRMHLLPLRSEAQGVEESAAEFARNIDLLDEAMMVVNQDIDVAHSSVDRLEGIDDIIEERFGAGHWARVGAEKLQARFDGLDAIFECQYESYEKVLERHHHSATALQASLDEVSSRIASIEKRPPNQETPTHTGNRHMFQTSLSSDPQNCVAKKAGPIIAPLPCLVG